MAERLVGQLSLADGLVSVPPNRMLEEVRTLVDWQAVSAVLGRRDSPGPGAPSYPGLVLFRCLLLGVWHGLSDEALEAAVADRISFRRFAGFGLDDATPDHTTLWRFREALQQHGLIDRLFAEIARQLDAKGLIVRRGTLVDASLIAAAARPPRKPRDTEADAEPRPSADRDARWGRRGKRSVFGYNLHIGVDQDHTLIRRMVLSDASVGDTERADELICGDEKAVYGDMIYSTHARHERLRAAGIKDRLMRRPNKHHPELPPRDKRRNRLIAKVRAGVERPFAVFKERYRLRRMRFFTVERNRVAMLLAASAYNLRRATAVPAAAPG